MLELKALLFTFGLCRFVGGSSALLATCYEEGSTPSTPPAQIFCYIEILCILDTPDWDNFIAILGPKWMAIEGALPHWPKEFENIPGVKAQIRARLGQRLQRFRDARYRAGVDPGNMFSNEFTDRMLFQD